MQQGVERRVLGLLVVVAERQRHDVDRLVPRPPVDAEQVPQGEQLEGPQQVGLVDLAVVAEQPHGQDQCVRAGLPDQAGDEGAVPGVVAELADEHVAGPLDLRGRRLSVGTPIGVPSTCGSRSTNALAEPRVPPDAGVEDRHHRTTGVVPGSRSRRAAGPSQFTG